MISPRRTRLLRVPDLRAFRDTVAARAVEGDPVSARARLVIVPTRGASRQLRRAIEDRTSAIGAVVLPDLVTRAQMIDRLHGRLADPPRRLTPHERDVMVRAAAREAAESGGGAPFRVRPGLAAAMLRFYDQLRQHGRGLARFEELAEEVLGRGAEYDRGASRILWQTRFLVTAFRAYERRLADANSCDDHTLREHLLVAPAPDPVRDIVVSVADWIADPEGLSLADFDLLSRIPGLETLDVVATVPLLASGFHERIHEWLPGIEEVDASDVHVRQRPTLAVPASASELFFCSRDREEELVSVARHAKAERRRAPGKALDRMAVVFRRPLPYLYLAGGVFGSAGIPFQSSDALPLASEPFAAALDLVVECVASSFTRSAVVALLRSPHFAFRDGPELVEDDSVAALDRALGEARYLGDLDRLRALAASWTTAASPDTDRARARPALGAALDAAEALAPLAGLAPTSRQLERLLEFVYSRLRPLADGDPDPVEARLLRARAAVLETIEALRAAHATHDDPPCRVDDLRVSIRRWIEEETFAPDWGDTGIQFVDDQAARYADFDDMTIVGVVEGEWPEPPERNIFYPAHLLGLLGWPSERERRGALEARLIELLGSPLERVAVSVFQLDDEALVEPSTQLEVLRDARLATRPVQPQPATRVLREEALAIAPPVLAALDERARAWADLRLSRTPGAAAVFHGQSDAAEGRAWSVSALELYLLCPFRFFARHVLRLQEEPDDQEVMDPRREGEFVHGVFEAFFRTWQESGGRGITPDNLDAARAAFERVVEERLATLPETEALQQRSRLLGSPVAAGLGETVLALEAERPVPVLTRLLEHKLEGTFSFDTAAGSRAIALKGKADRLDLLADGTFRLIDYKLGRPPSKTRALQLATYGLCAEQQLNAERMLGRQWALGEAAYIAFGGPKRVDPLFPARQSRERVLATAQERLVATVDAIARGEFPPRPENVRHCATCPMAAVCRKDYVGDV